MPTSIVNSVDIHPWRVSVITEAARETSIEFMRKQVLLTGFSYPFEICCQHDRFDQFHVDLFM